MESQFSFSIPFSMQIFDFRDWNFEHLASTANWLYVKQHFIIKFYISDKNKQSCYLILKKQNAVKMQTSRGKSFSRRAVFTGTVPPTDDNNGPTRTSMYTDQQKH